MCRRWDLSSWEREPEVRARAWSRTTLTVGDVPFTLTAFLGPDLMHEQGPR